MTTLITLTTAGSDSGPFDLYSDSNNYATPFETGIAKSALVAGYYTTKIPDFSNMVRIQSVGVCTNYLQLPLVYPPIGGGTIVLDIQGVGTNIPPALPGANPINGYTLNSSLTMRNKHTSESIRFSNASLSPPYSIIAVNGAARILNYTGGISCHLNTAPQENETIPPNSYASWLSFGKSGSNTGYVVLSIETFTNTGNKQQFFWTFNI